MNNEKKNEINWTSAHDSLYFWVSDHREEIVNAIKAGYIGFPCSEHKNEIKIEKFTVTLGNIYHASSNPDIIITLVAPSGVKSVINDDEESDAEGEFQGLYKMCNDCYIYSMDVVNHAWKILEKEQGIRHQEIKFIKDKEIENNYAIDEKVEFCEGRKFTYAIELQPIIQGHFGSILAQCNHHREIAVIDKPYDPGNTTCHIDGVLLITPDKSADKYFEDQGILVYHPDWKFEGVKNE